MSLYDVVMSAPLILTPTIITIDRSRFRLTLWKLRGRRYRRVKRYEIAVGAIGHTTPSGVYWVESKSRTPAWKAPEWAKPPIEPGKVYQYGEEGNPFFGGFISFAESEGVGMHGVNFDPKLGTRASHGCIRMADEDILDVYDRVPMGTPVFIY